MPVVKGQCVNAEKCRGVAKLTYFLGNQPLWFSVCKLLEFRVVLARYQIEDPQDITTMPERGAANGKVSGFQFGIW
jgi:hypothetical protein